jgi:hypothetical protein
MNRIFRTVFGCMALMLCIIDLSAQFPYFESFANANAPGLHVSGAAKLTAATGADLPGEGYLRLNENIVNSVGYVYNEEAFPSQYGLTVSFDFFSWKSDANSINQADGMTFFLFDASVNSFRPGGSGGSLGYAQYYTTAGMARGYIGISIDDYGNFSSASDGNKNGGPGQQRGSIAIRGPGNGTGAGQYIYQTGVITANAPYNAGFTGFKQRYPDSTNVNFRRLKVILTPGSTLGTSVGYTVTVIMYKGGAPVTPVTLINNFDYPFAAPANLKFGLASSTGSITNFHEIRNLGIGVTNSQLLSPAVAVNDNGVIACQGSSALIDVIANDHSANTGGSIDPKSVDLDPASPGIQNSYADAGKGIYTVNDKGIVSFDPMIGYAGNSTTSYVVSDSYGAVSAAASINITVSSNIAPVLTVIDPPAVCSPSVVDITGLAWKVSSTPGSTFDYFNNLTDAQQGINNINSSAANISQAGTYYIKAGLNGCTTVRPILAKIAAIASLANAGADQSFCASTGSLSTIFTAANPDIGLGTWSQVSGPAAANIVYESSATTTVSNMARGVYVFRWSISNGACALRTDDIQVSVGVASNAGPTQVVTGTTVTLAGNTASPATGSWSQLSGPSALITNPADPGSSVTGLIPGGSYGFNWRIVNGNCTSNSQVSVSVALTLPVKLLYFKGSRVAEGVLLGWKTGLELDNEYFDIQRSENGKDFTSVGRVKNSLSPDGKQVYGYLDKIIGRASEVLYYRLKQVSIDGTFSYSNTIIIGNTKEDFSVSISPNPFVEKINLRYRCIDNCTAQARIFNNAGILMKKINLLFTTGDNHFIIDDVEGFPKGMYVIEVKVGDHIYRKKLFKE